MLYFSELHRASKERTDNHFAEATKSWTLGDWGCGLAGEAGEACNWIKKLRRGDGAHLAGGDEALKHEIGKELADVVIYCELIATEIGVDLGKVVVEKFNEVSDRYDCSVRLELSLPRHKRHLSSVETQLEPFLNATCVDDLKRQWEHLLRAGDAVIPPERPTR